MRADGMTHDTDTIVQSRDFLIKLAEHSECPKEVQGHLVIVLDTLRDMAKQIVARPKGLDRELAGKVIDRLLR